MKTFVFCCLLLAATFAMQSGYAQESCKVLMAGISGQYEGECRKGKASGKGKAEGTDLYIGEFKEGLPHGKGTYRWKNGDFYEGEWANGKKQGTGGMSIKRSGKTDSVITGFWKKDTYIGKHEKPFKIINRTQQVTKADVTFFRAKEREITLLLSNTTGNTPTLNRGVTPKVALTDIVIVTGSYLRLVDLFDGNKQTAYKLDKVTFPFRAQFKIGNQEVDVEFFEEGKYTFEIVLNN